MASLVDTFVFQILAKREEEGKKGHIFQDVIDDYIHKLLWYKRDIPNTTGREVFRDEEAVGLIHKIEGLGDTKEDVIASLAPTTPDHIQKIFPHMRLTWLDEVKFPSDANDAVSFAWMEMEAIVGRRLLGPKRFVTETPCVVGKITPGNNFGELMTMGTEFGKSFKGMLPAVKSLQIEKGWTGRAVHDYVPTCPGPKPFW